MRKIIVLSFISLDGVMQAPGGPKKPETRERRMQKLLEMMADGKKLH